MDTELTAFLAAQASAGGLRVLRVCLRTRPATEQAEKLFLPPVASGASPVVTCLSASFFFCVCVLPHHVDSTPGFLSSIIGSPFISTLHPPPSSASARVDSIPATSRINKLSHLDALPSLRCGWIRPLKRTERCNLPTYLSDFSQGRCCQTAIET